jgi:hypothetical protein
MRELYANQLLDTYSKGKGWKIAAKLSGGDMLRFFATGGNPIFILGNVAADFSNILFLSDVYGKNKLFGAPKLAYDFLRNFFRATTGKNFSQIKREYLEHGGAMDYMASDGIRNMRSRINKYRALNARQKVVKKAGQVLSFLGEKSEEAFRIAVSEKTKNDLIKKWQKENKTNENPTGQELEDIMNEAVREAREVIDFNQGGTWAKNADSVLPYFNVSFQGWKRVQQYWKKSPRMFAASMAQAAGMSVGLQALSLGILNMTICDDDDSTKECSEKMKLALDSISAYEKANYHIIFTGKKDENGEWEYIRIKRLPILGIITSYADYILSKFYLGVMGTDYDSKDSIFLQSVKTSLPIDVTDIFGIASRNPAYSAYMAGWHNYDTFKGEEIWKKPLRYHYDDINPEVEGLSDDNVNNFFKALAPYFDLSPIRTQAFFEKLITSEQTNPVVSLMYAMGNGLFVWDSEYKDTFKGAMENLLKNTSRKLIRSTNKKIAEYTEEDEAAEVTKNKKSETLAKEEALFKEVEDLYKEGKRLTDKELSDIILKYFDAPKAKKYKSKVIARIKRRDISRDLLDIAYEEDPELQAYYIYKRYGKTFEEEENVELNNLLRSTNKTISKEAKYYYNKNYRLK